MGRIFPEAQTTSERGTSVTQAEMNREPDEVLRGDRVVIGRGVVGGRGRPDDEAFRIGGGEEVRSGLGIGIIAIERVLPG